MFKNIIDETASKDHGGFLHGDVRKSYDQALNSVDFDHRPKAIKEFLINNGYQVTQYGEKSTHHYAETSCGLYISSNGYVVKK